MNTKLLVFSLFALGTVTAAQADDFEAHGALQVQGGMAYTLGEAPDHKLWSPEAALSYQYLFNPYFTLRSGLSGWQSKGGFSNPYTVTYKYDYVNLNFDAMFNLSNAFAGYKERRIFNLYAFAGVFGNVAWHNQAAKELSYARYFDLEYLWEDARWSVGGRVGVMADFRLCKHLSLNLEWNANALTDHYNSKKGNNIDWFFNHSAGITYHFNGKTKSYTRTEVAPAPVPVVQEEKTSAPAVQTVVKHDTIEVIKVVHDTVRIQSAPEKIILTAEERHLDLFFKIREAIISDNDDAQLKKLAAWCKENKIGKISVAGYADKGTGTAASNLKFSRQRAEQVAKTLQEKYGIDPSQIVVTAFGDTVQPFKENDKNRCVQIDVREQL